MVEKHILVIGGGASGMMAAIVAAEQGKKVTLLEKNEQLGKKILISGKGRCNVTNDKEISEFVQYFPSNGKFLYTAFYAFSNQDTKAFFEEAGVPLKVERGERVFPVSDRSKDILAVLEKKLRKNKVAIKVNSPVQGLLTKDGAILGVILTNGQQIYGDAVIVATGGASYPGTGTTGDGYLWAEKIGHRVIPIRPALVPLETKEPWIKELQGLSLKNVNLTIKDKKGQVIAHDFGEMLFTHYGLSGPIVLTISTEAVNYWQKQPEPLEGVLDLKPALSVEQLNMRLLREIETQHNKHYKTMLGSLMPQKLIPVFIKLSGIDGGKVMHQLTKEERLRIVDLLKNLTFTLTKARPLSEAIVTSGGVCVKEVSPKTMESKLVKNLYFTGEVLDIDGVTGGFNLQAAFSTGYLAGISAAESSV